MNWLLRQIAPGHWRAVGPFIRDFASFEDAIEWIDHQRYREPS